MTGAHLAYIFAMSNRRISKGECVLYCGPSNKAVDVVHGKKYLLFSGTCCMTELYCKLFHYYFRSVVETKQLAC